MFKKRIAQGVSLLLLLGFGFVPAVYADIPSPYGFSGGSRQPFLAPSGLALALVVLAGVVVVGVIAVSFIALRNVRKKQQKDADT